VFPSNRGLVMLASCINPSPAAAAAVVGEH